MKLIALHVYWWVDDAPFLLNHVVSLDVTPFFQVDFIKEHLNFNSRLIAGRTSPGEKLQIALDAEVGVCYSQTAQDLISATAICTLDYPQKCA